MAFLVNEAYVNMFGDNNHGQINGPIFANTVHHTNTDNLNVTRNVQIGSALSVGECAKANDGIIALGDHASASAKGAVVIGEYSSSTHRNSIVIGNNLLSKNDNSVLIDEVEITKGKILCGDTVSIIFDNLNNNAQNSDAIACSACENPIVRGVKWFHDGYKKDGVEYKDIELGLCFDCIYDCVLEFKTKYRWQSKMENLNTIDPLDKIRADIRELQNTLNNIKST